MSKKTIQKALGKIKSARDCHFPAINTLLFEAEEILEEALAAHQEPLSKPLVDLHPGLDEKPKAMDFPQENYFHVGWVARSLQGRLCFMTDFQIDSSIEKYGRLHKLSTQGIGHEPPAAPRSKIQTRKSRPQPRPVRIDWRAGNHPTGSAILR